MVEILTKLWVRGDGQDIAEYAVMLALPRINRDRLIEASHLVAVNKGRPTASDTPHQCSAAFPDAIPSS